jgi:hypothetical protein
MLTRAASQDEDSHCKLMKKNELMMGVGSETARRAGFIRGGQDARTEVTPTRPALTAVIG